MTEQELHDYTQWVMGVWPKTKIPFADELPKAYLRYKEDQQSRSSVWQPTPSIRWKKVETGKFSYREILQQLWRGDKGEEEWLDVPEVE